MQNAVMDVEDVGALVQRWQQPPAAGATGPDELLSIGTFARRCRLSLKALRLYDRLGVLTPEHVDAETGYRWYRESQLTTARLVAMLRRLDMPLAEVSRIASAPSALGAVLLASYWDGVEHRIASQRELAAHLGVRLSGGRGRPAMFDEPRLRDVPDQAVLTEQRHVRVEDLSRWLSAGMPILAQSARSFGGVCAPPFVIYHGEVNTDSDGPVEICVPIGAMPELPVDGIRNEPAHREAYLRLRKAQVEYPQILSAFDAVAEWVGQRELAVTGPPREVYFNDFQSAAPTDDVCDVAFPVG